MHMMKGDLIMKKKWNYHELRSSDAMQLVGKAVMTWEGAMAKNGDGEFAFVICQFRQLCGKRIKNIDFLNFRNV